MCNFLVSKGHFLEIHTYLNFYQKLNNLWINKRVIERKRIFQKSRTNENFDDFKIAEKRYKK